MRVQRRIGGVHRSSVIHLAEAKCGGTDMRSSWVVAVTVIVAFCAAGACGGAVPEGDAAAFCPAYEEYQISLDPDAFTSYEELGALSAWGSPPWDLVEVFRSALLSPSTLKVLPDFWTLGGVPNVKRS